MPKNQIVIVTQIRDAHADEMVLALRDMGHEPIRLNTNDIPSNIVMSLSFKMENCTGTIKNETNGRTIDVQDIRSVWWRRPSSFGLPTNLSEQEISFCQDEIDHAFRGLWASVDCYWVSYPESIRTASWKIEQLRRAARLGFEVPRTILTNDPEQARAFYHTCDRQVVYKVLTSPFLNADKIRYTENELSNETMTVLTTLVGENELAMLNSVRLVPCLFQEYVHKRLELRVTVIGDEVFAAEIHSEADERTNIDWRSHPLDIPYQRANLPVRIAEACLALARSYHLNFSAIDLILTPDGQYVFLENNPNGQFMFVERQVPELRMTAALASCLIRGANS